MQLKNSAYHNLVVFSQKLRVERTGNVKLLSYLPGGLFDLKDEQIKIVLKTKHGTLNPPIHKQFGTPPPQKQNKTKQNLTLTASDSILAAKRNLKHKSVDARA